MRDERDREHEPGWQADLGSYGAESAAGDHPKAADSADESGPADPFFVEIKRSARERNEAAAELAGKHGDILEYASRRAAAERARALSATGDIRVCLQGVAPQDQTDADAYLVAQPRRHVDTPYDTERNGLTFDVSGNQYGAIAEALLTTPGTNPPALTYYVRNDLDVEDDVRVETELDRVTTCVVNTDDERRTATWEADLVATAHRVSTGATVREYWCEIKAGGGSFERDQKAVMRAKAADPDISVLTIRVDLDALPDQYGVRIEPVTE